MLTAKQPNDPCKVCGQEFIRYKSFESAVICGSRRCLAGFTKGLLHARKVAVSQSKASDRQKREDLKTKPQLLEEAQIAFRAWIRERDHGNACICCGKYPKGDEALTGGAWDGGHFRSRGACPELAFDENNCHLQLKRCNHRSWDVASYRANLIAKIGHEAVDSLEGPHPPKKYSRDDLRAMRDDYRARTKLLIKARENQ